MMPLQWIESLRGRLDPSELAKIEFSVQSIYAWIADNNMDITKPLQLESQVKKAPRKEPQIGANKKHMPLVEAIEKHIANFLVDRGGIKEQWVDTYLYLRMGDGSEFRLIIQKMKVEDGNLYK